MRRCVVCVVVHFPGQAYPPTLSTGQVRIMLNSFQDRAVHKAWYPLLDSSLEGDSDRGQLEICARWVHNPALKPHFFHEDDDRPDKVSEI